MADLANSEVFKERVRTPEEKFGKLCCLKVCMKHAVKNIMLCH